MTPTSREVEASGGDPGSLEGNADATQSATSPRGAVAVSTGDGPPRETPVDPDVLLVLACGALAALLAFAGAPAPIRLYPGLAAVLVLPGWSLQMALFPRRGDLGGVERLSLALGLSVAAITVLALALDASPGGLGPRGMVVGIAGCTLAALAVAWARRRRVAADCPRESVWPNVMPAASRASALAGWLLAASLLAASIALGVVVGAPDAEGTEFSMVGAQGLMEQYPRVIGPGPAVVRVAVASHRRTLATYYVVVQLDGAPLASSGPIALAPGATWQGPVNISAPASPGDQAIGLVLYEDGRTDPCCRLWLRMHADAGSSASLSAPP